MNKNNLEQQFESARTIAMDPVNMQRNESGEAETSLYSPWLHLPCSKCQHTFRLGDPVEISPTDGSVCHQTSVTACTGEEQVNHKKLEEVSLFYKGLDTSWPPPENSPVVRLEAGHPLLAPAYAGFQRYTCAVCGHTLRPYDMVIICPCKPNKPMCRIAIHRDPIRGLYCWDEWNPGKYSLHCPATSRKLDER